jgi:hypothetical protein
VVISGAERVARMPEYSSLISITLFSFCWLVLAFGDGA